MAARPRPSESYDDVPLSALLHAARRTYSDAVDRAQSKAGLVDLPSTGSFIVSAMHWSDASLEAVIQWMGVTKQAVSQAVDALVVRGYLERAPDPRDRRRVRLRLTARGRAAGRAARSAVEEVDRALGERVGGRRIAGARATLAALIDLGRRARTSGR